MRKDLWFEAYKRACDAFADDGDEGAFRRALVGLGFESDAISNEICSVLEEQGE